MKLHNVPGEAGKQEAIRLEEEEAFEGQMLLALKLKKVKVFLWQKKDGTWYLGGEEKKDE